MKKKYAVSDADSGRGCNTLKINTDRQLSNKSMDYCVCSRVTHLGRGEVEETRTEGNDGRLGAVRTLPQGDGEGVLAHGEGFVADDIYRQSCGADNLWGEKSKWTNRKIQNIHKPN